MVSIWPWKTDDTSPASFEKTLSALSTKIAKATSRLESCRQQSRRFKGLWTLYSSFAYILYVAIVALVVGWKNWGPIEYSAVSGGPVIVYLVRLGLTAFYDYRISSLQANLNGLQKQRETAIDKLKTATKYNTTQQLLEKYGGTPTKPKSTAPSVRKATPNHNLSGGSNVGRTGIAPPATANIPGRNGPVSLPSTPQGSSPLRGLPGPVPPFTAAAATSPWQQDPASPMEQSAEFAPNAFSAPPQYAQVGTGPKWYDRFMDLLLGEDETSPKNRLVLICKKCRLVNGQAPPGVKSLEDVGKWRCSDCGTMNGEESEAKTLVAEINKETLIKSGPARAQSAGRSLSPGDGIDEEVVLVRNGKGSESDITVYSNEENKISGEEGGETGLGAKSHDEEVKPEKRKRGRPKGSGKKKS